MCGFRDCPAESIVATAVPCIEPIITGHLEVLFRYMLDEQGNKVHNGNRFFHVGIVLMFVVVESHVLPVIGINAGSGDDRASEVAADVFYNGISVTEIRFGIDIEAIFVLFVDSGLRFFERSPDAFFELIEECGLESLAQIGIVKVSDVSPETIIREAALGKEAVDMWIPFQGSAEGMEDTDETWDKIFAFIQFMEHPEDDTADSLEKTVKEGAVVQEERAQVFVDGKNEVPMGTVNEFEEHFGGAVNAVFIAAGWTELGMAAERDKFKSAAMGAPIHGAAVRRVPAVDHFFDVFHDNGTGMKDIFDFFVMFFKNLLKDVHKSIMQEMGEERNPTPQD